MVAAKHHTVLSPGIETAQFRRGYGTYEVALDRMERYADGSGRP